MATIVIPAQKIFVCDCCKKENQPQRKGCIMKFDQAALDYQGCPVANGGFSLELCDSCAHEIQTLIYAAVEAKSK